MKLFLEKNFFLNRPKTFLFNRINMKNQEDQNLFKQSKISLNSQRGQVTVEILLLALVLTVFFHSVIKVIRDGGSFDNFASTPNKLIGHMIANGNWKRNEMASKNDHPNRYGRRYSWDPP